MLALTITLILFASPLMLVLPSAVKAYYPDVKYALFCQASDLDATFLQKIVDGKFDIILPNMAYWETDNTLTIVANATINDFISQVKAVNPYIEVYCWFSAFGTNKPDLSTEALRQLCINEVAYLVQNYDFDGYLDDTEKYTGDSEDQWAYFTDCGAAITYLGEVYSPWQWYTSLNFVDSEYDSVGAYSTHSFTETVWKSALDIVQANAENSFGWYMIVENLSTPTLTEQLTFLDEQIALHGIDYYSKFDVLGLYWYQSMNATDWAAWESFVATPIPTPTPTPTPSPTTAPTPPATSPTPTPNPPQPYYTNDVIASGSGFNILVNVGESLAFQHAITNSTINIEVLSGTINGSESSVAMTERYGVLSFTSSDTAQIQLSTTNTQGVRLEYDGLSLTTLEPRLSWNGTIPASGDVLLRWSFRNEMIHETYFMFLLGMFGFGLVMFGGLFTAWGIRKKENLENMMDFLMYSAIAIILGIGCIVIWLWG